MKKLIAGVTALALAGSLSAASLTTAQAAPTTVAARSALSPQTNLIDVKYRAKKKVTKRHHVRRHVRHRRYGNNAAAAAVFGLFGAALANAIASSRYDDDYYYGPRYYYGPGYYPGYYSGYRYAPRPRYGYVAPRPRYGYVAPRVHVRPAWGGGHRWGGRAFHGGWQHRGGFQRGGGIRRH